MQASPSSRRAWIEIAGLGRLSACGSVALLTEGVDRNNPFPCYFNFPCVALLTEGVDRNTVGQLAGGCVGRVALLTEGVDRNTSLVSVNHSVLSPSSRRAWIEMLFVFLGWGLKSVALLTEGVDRNAGHDHYQRPCGRRPPHGGRG